MPQRFGTSRNAESAVAAGRLPLGKTAAVLGTALAMRLLVIVTVLRHYPPQWLFTRGIEMGLLAESLLAGNGLSSPFGGSTGPTAFIAPIYPMLVALVFRMFGEFTVVSAVVVMLVQTALNLMTIWMMMRVAWRVFSQASAMVAGLIWAGSLPLIWMPTIFWETSLSCCLLMGLIALVLRYSEIKIMRPIHWMRLGAYCGFTSLVNPALVLALASVVVWLWLQRRKTAARWPLLTVVTFVVVFAPWPIRNARVFHAFIPLRTTVGFELWMGNRPDADGMLDETLFPMYNKAELADYMARGEVAYSANKATLAKNFMRAQPGTFVRMTGLRFLRFWTGTGSRGGSKVFMMHAVLTTGLGIAGLWLLARSKRYALATLFTLPLVVFPLPYMITHAEFRYRLVIDPVLAMLAGYAVTELCGFLMLRSGSSLEKQGAVPVTSIAATGRTI